MDLYDLCNQTVTVYHQEGAGIYTRTLHTRAFFEFKKTQTVDKTGSREANGFLLVIPGDTQAVFAGDKVMLGEGPEITSSKEWSELIPTKGLNLAVVSYADPKYFDGMLVHTEAGG